MKTNKELAEKIENLKEKRKDMGQYRVSCANLGRGVTDSILKDMEKIDDEIRILQGLMEK
jgi:hypothetical protein